jgi:peptidyl-prolyl cis-trans isomerase B (cyclophilin B)
MRNLSILFVAIFAIACGPKEEVVTISTDFGDMKVVLYDDTPIHKANFLKLAKSGQYDSTIFHRVISGFMIQGGDLSTTPEGGQSSSEVIPAEILPHRFHKKGAIAAARMGDNVNPERNSSATQFYIVQGNVFQPEQIQDLAESNYIYQQRTLFNQLLAKPEYQYLADSVAKYSQSGDIEGYADLLNENMPIIEREFGPIVKKEYPEDHMNVYKTIGGSPHLDFDYTVFGEVIDGLNIIDSVAAVEKGPNDRPVDRVGIKVSVDKVSTKKLKELYGYTKEEE